VYYPYINKQLLWRDIDIAEGAIKLSFDPVVAVGNDKQIRMAIFYQINKERPLFSAPGLDIDELHASVNKLRTSQADLLNVLGLSDDMYPLDYLQACAEVSQASERFEADPTSLNAKELLKAERKATSLYRNYANSLKSKLSRIKLPSSLFSQAGATTSKDIIIEDLEKTITNSRKLDLEIDSRSRCLSWSSLFCHRKALKPFATRSDDNLQNSSLFPAQNLQSGATFTTNGVYQIDSPCWKKDENSTETHLVYALVNNDNNVLIPQLASNRFFEPLTPEAFGEPLFDEYKKLGVDWQVNYMDNAYTCNNLEYQAGITTINAYYNRFASKPLLKDVEVTLFPSTLQEMVRSAQLNESIFASEKYPSEATLGKIINDYAKIYNYLVLDTNRAAKTDKFVGLAPLRDEMLFRFSFFDNQLADYPENLNYLSLRDSWHARISEVNIKGKVESEYVYFMRNAYSITLLGFSPSVWQSEARLQYLDKNSKVSSNLIDNNDFVKKFGQQYTDKVASVTRELVIGKLIK